MDRFSLRPVEKFHPWLLLDKIVRQIFCVYERMCNSMFTSKKPPTVFIKIFSIGFTNCKDLLLQSRDCSCYVSRPILAPPPLWLLKHTYLRAYDFAHSPDLWRQPRISNCTRSWSWRLCGINPTILDSISMSRSLICLALRLWDMLCVFLAQTLRFLDNHRKASKFWQDSIVIFWPTFPSLSHLRRLCAVAVFQYYQYK